MKKLALALILLSSCHTKKEMTMEELKKAHWELLDKGIEYISMETGKAGDSIMYTSQDIAAPDISNIDSRSLPTTLVAYEGLTKLLNQKSPESKSGYLKIDLYSLFKPDTIKVTAYLKSNVPETIIHLYMDSIRVIRGVLAINFISPEMAKQKYLGDGNQNWDSVLTANPLPASIEIDVSPDYVSYNFLEKLKEKIKSEMPYVDQVSYSTIYNRLDGLKGSAWYLRYERL